MDRLRTKKKRKKRTAFPLKWQERKLSACFILLLLFRSHSSYQLYNECKKRQRFLVSFLRLSVFFLFSVQFFSGQKLSIQRHKCSNRLINRTINRPSLHSSVKHCGSFRWDKFELDRHQEFVIENPITCVANHTIPNCHATLIYRWRCSPYL